MGAATGIETATAVTTMTIESVLGCAKGRARSRGPAHRVVAR